jgi:molecular chaperone DnaJ
VSEKRDYYATLGVGRNASEQEIKSSYRKLAMQFHPDRNPDNPEAAGEKFKEITEAYSVLIDSQKRAAYDRFGHAGVSGAGGFTPDFSSTIFADFEDIFGDLFGIGDIFGRARSGRRSASERGSDLRYELDISFEEAASGLDTKIKIPRWELCGSCGGHGARKGSEPETCSACGGRGQIRHQQGFFTLTRPCPQCHGLGQVIREACSDCHGEGRVRHEKVLGIKIPAGVEDGMRLRVNGEGDAGNRGGSSGDLYVVLRVREHPYFERRGNDLYCTIPISVPQAVLGTEIKVPTLRGTERLKIPEGTQTGSVFRIRGKGLPNLDGRGQGDLYVNIAVVTPTKLSREQRRLVESLMMSLQLDNKPIQRRVYDRVKDVFG